MTAMLNPLLVASMLACLARAVEAQDSTVVLGERGRLALDTARLRPFSSAFDMLAHTADSIQVIGRRTLTVAPATYVGEPAWLLVETRSGAVPAVESLFVAPDMRPLHWSSWRGTARLAMAFTRDSVFGVTGGPAGRQSIVLAAPPDLIVSTAMIEVLLPLIAFTPFWTDSVSVLSVTHVATAVIPCELTVIGEDELALRDERADAAAARVTRGAWVVVLRAQGHSILLWVDRESGDLLRLQQPLPMHGASLLEYRRTAAPTAAPDGLR